jgi:hypothetical protein
MVGLEVSKAHLEALAFIPRLKAISLWVKARTSAVRCTCGSGPAGTFELLRVELTSGCRVPVQALSSLLPTADVAPSAHIVRLRGSLS